jgi:hypothetical protein
MRQFHRWYRHPRTTQERRASFAYKGYIRPSRNFRNLPNTYDDLVICHQKSWKKKRKTQYYVGGRGEAKTIYIEAASEYTSNFSWAYKGAEWILKEFLEDNNIAYTSETVKQGKLYWSFCRNKWVVSYKTVGYKITYWSKKDLSKALTFLGIGV